MVLDGACDRLGLLEGFPTINTMGRVPLKAACFIGKRHGLNRIACCIVVNVQVDRASSSRAESVGTSPYKPEHPQRVTQKSACSCHASQATASRAAPEICEVMFKKINTLSAPCMHLSTR